MNSITNILCVVIEATIAYSLDRLTKRALVADILGTFRTARSTRIGRYSIWAPRNTRRTMIHSVQHA